MVLLFPLSLQVSDNSRIMSHCSPHSFRVATSQENALLLPQSSTQALKINCWPCPVTSPFSSVRGQTGALQKDPQPPYCHTGPTVDSHHTVSEVSKSKRPQGLSDSLLTSPLVISIVSICISSTNYNSSSFLMICLMSGLKTGEGEQQAIAR